jgi:hypothetical protein
MPVTVRINPVQNSLQSFVIADATEHNDGVMTKEMVQMIESGAVNMAIGGIIANSPLVGSVLFVGAGGVLAQDNANFFWDDTNNRLAVAGLDVDGTTANAFASFVNGDTAAVSAVNTGRLRYNSATQTFQVSMNGAAYTDVQTGAEFTLDIGDAIGASTVGSVLFVGAGNLLAQDNANFFWDDATNRLGIGNAAPAATLHVTGTARVSSTLTLDPMTAGSVFFAGVAGVVSQDNANFFWDNTNDFLGIGTAAPTNQFHVEKTTTAFAAGSETQTMIHLLVNPSADASARDYVQGIFLVAVDPANAQAINSINGAQLQAVNSGVGTVLFQTAGSISSALAGSALNTYVWGANIDASVNTTSVGTVAFILGASITATVASATPITSFRGSLVAAGSTSALLPIATFTVQETGTFDGFATQLLTGGSIAGEANMHLLRAFPPFSGSLIYAGTVSQLRFESQSHGRAITQTGSQSSSFEGDVGLGQAAAASPVVACDVGRDFAVRIAAKTAVNGNNNNFATTDNCFCRVTGPTAVFAFTGFAQPLNGKILYVLNASGFTMTIAHQSASSTAANRIITGTAADIAFADQRLVMLIYSSTASRWVLEQVA